MRYKIFLDTNQVFNKKPLQEPFSTSLSDLRSFLTKNKLQNVEICVPEVVVAERIQQKVEEIEQMVSQANEIIDSLKEVGHKDKIIKLKTSYRKFFEKKVNDVITALDIRRVPMPSVNNKDLIERAINKLKPFNDNGAGFKDTLIYLSIIEDALSRADSADRYIFCTNDHKEFDETVCTEFKRLTDRDLYILPSVVKVSEKLDELIPLGLHLTERNQKISNMILNQIGDLMLAINGRFLRQDDSYPRGSYRQAVMSMSPREMDLDAFGNLSFVDKKDVVGYNFKKISFQRFEESKDGNFNVYVNVVTKIKYKDDETSVTGSTNSFWYKSAYQSFLTHPEEATFAVEVRCDITAKRIEIMYVSNAPF